jgi:hypothetical protein
MSLPLKYAIDDEGGGYYLVLNSIPDDPEPGQVQIGF